MSSNQAQQANDAEKNIEIWKVKKLIKRLEAARGNGTSMISLIIRMFFFFLGGGVVCSGLRVSRLTLLCYSAQGSGISSSEDVGGRICKFPSLFGCGIWKAGEEFMLMGVIGYCFQHQISCQSTFCPFGHYVHAATTQALQQGPSERPGCVLR